LRQFNGNIIQGESQQTSILVSRHERTWRTGIGTELKQRTGEAKQMAVESPANADDSTGAASCETEEWQAINWQTATLSVRRLQVRIVKAVQEGRWGKVKSLQHLLTHSFSARALAVKRVTENTGKPEFRPSTTGSEKGPWRGLSRMR
jgi:hypothetical protein